MSQKVGPLFDRVRHRVRNWLVTAVRPVASAVVHPWRQRSAAHTPVFVWSGAVGSLVGVATVLVATLRSPTFSWTDNAISDLGASGASHPQILNVGLVTSSLLAVPFVYVLWCRASHRVERAGAVAYALSLVSLGCIGAFPVGDPLHTPVSVAFFTFGTVTLLVHGTGTVLGGAVQRGLGSIWLGLVHVISWILWDVGARLGPGLAIPELIGAVLVVCWLGWTTAVLATASDHPRTTDDTN